MSYNYLPLDRKWLNFQQIKNLLDYHQLVSITFDAHERILKCREYIDSKSVSILSGTSTLDHSRLEQLQQKNKAGEEVPVRVVKLMMMLKIKSLGYGHSGVQIDTVKRLMDMYNTGVFPVIYKELSSADSNEAALGQLSLPLPGLGEVYYKGEKRKSADVLNELGWQPISLRDIEVSALISGTQFTSAFAMYALKKADKLLAMSNAIAALSIETFNGSLQPFNNKIHALRNHKGQIETAAIIRGFLSGSEILPQDKHDQEDSLAFRCIPRVHGAAKDAFEYVLSIFLKEINSVTETAYIFPDDDVVLKGNNCDAQSLYNALHFLSIVLADVGGFSERRIWELMSGQRGLPDHLSVDGAEQAYFKDLKDTASRIAAENRQLCSPALADSMTLNRKVENPGVIERSVAVRCLEIVENVERILAIELMSAAQAMEFRRPAKTSVFLEDLLAAFTREVPLTHKSRLLHDDILKSVDFITNYNI